MEKVYYGKTVMYRTECPICNNPILGINGEFECDCGWEQSVEKWKKIVVEAPPQGKRKGCPAKLRNRIYEEQNGRCFWCGRRFFIPYYKNKKICFLKPNYDHAIPFSYEQSNRDENWVASCSVCNLYKTNMLFKTVEEVRQHLERRWAKEIKRGKIIL